MFLSFLLNNKTRMLKLFKGIFKSLFFAYKNIFHFIFSKILIIFSTIIIWILFTLPFLLLVILIIYLSPLELWNFIIWWSKLLEDFIFNKVWFIIVSFFIVLSILVFVFTINYRRILFAKLNLKYIDWEKLKFTKNYYFNFWLIFKNIEISFLIFWGLLFISLIFIILFIFLVLIFWWVQEINTILISSSANAFSIISLLLIILYFIIIFYFLYRTYFSFYILLEDNKKNVFKIVKKSIKKTKKVKNIFKLGLVFLLFLIILAPYNYYSELNDFNRKNISYYVELKNKIILKEEITEKEKIDYTFLNNDLWQLKKKELVEIYNKNSTINIIYFILHFIFIVGVFDLVMINFYKREIK